MRCESGEKGDGMTDEEELEMRCALSGKGPCVFRSFLLANGWVVDAECPIKALARREFEGQLTRKDQSGYDKEYPDG